MQKWLEVYELLLWIWLEFDIILNENKEGLKKQVLYLMEQAKNSLELKRKTITKWLERGLYPYTYRYLRSFRNHFSTIWLNWMNEAILNFTNWKEDISTIWWKDLL